MATWVVRFLSEVKTNGRLTPTLLTRRLGSGGKIVYFNVAAGNLRFKINSIDDDDMDAKMKALGKVGYVTYCPHQKMWRLGGLCNIRRCYKDSNTCDGTKFACTDKAGPVEDFIQNILLKYMANGEVADKEEDEIGHGDDEIKVKFVNEIKL